MADFNPAQIVDTIFQDQATLDKTRADTANTESATAINWENLREAQGLFPGKLEAQDLDNKQTAAKTLGIEAATQLDAAQTAGLWVKTQENAVALKYADQKNRLDLEKQQAEINASKAQIKMFAAQTAEAIAKLDTEHQKQMDHYNMYANQGLSIVKGRVDAGDIPGASAAYSALLQSLPPEFIRFESTMLGRVGAAFDQKDHGALAQAINDGIDYTGHLVPKDSFMGESQLEAQKAAAAKEVATIQANGKSGKDDVAEEAKKDKQVDAIVRPNVYRVLSTLNSEVQAKGPNVFVGGQPASSGTTAGIEAIVDTSKKVYKQFTSKNKQVDITNELTGSFQVGKMDLGNWTDTKNLVVPANEKDKAELQKAIMGDPTAKSKELREGLVGRGYSPQKAYEYAIQQYTLQKAKAILQSKGLLKDYK